MDKSISKKKVGLGDRYGFELFEGDILAVPPKNDRGGWEKGVIKREEKSWIKFMFKDKFFVEKKDGSISEIPDKQEERILIRFLNKL